MKITLPTIEIDENESFSTEKDIFRRKDFGEKLISLFENTDEELVVALNAPWGEGKSTFINMWQNHIKLNKNENKIKTIYFDAFKNDYQKDPFLTITSELYSICDIKDEVKDEFIENAKKVGKSLVRGSFKLGAKVLTSGLLDDTVFKENTGDISSLLNENIDLLIENRIKNHNVDKEAFSKFKKDLEKFIEDEKPLVFIVDELDRCRPDFALELLEQIKHLFSVKNLHFLLVVNSKQLESSIKSKYGNEINASQYLQKFITLTLELPKKSTEYENYNQLYVKWALEQMLIDDDIVKNTTLIDTVEELVSFYNPSFREIERILSNLAVLHNISPESKYYDYHQIAMAFICYIKVMNPEVFYLIRDRNSTIEEVYKKLDFNERIEETSSQYSFFIPVIKSLLRLDYSNEQERQKIINDDPTLKSYFNRGYSFHRESLFKNIIGNLSTLSNR